MHPTLTVHPTSHGIPTTHTRPPWPPGHGLRPPAAVRRVCDPVPVSTQRHRLPGSKQKGPSPEPWTCLQYTTHRQESLSTSPCQCPHPLGNSLRVCKPMLAFVLPHTGVWGRARVAWQIRPAGITPGVKLGGGGSCIQVDWAAILNQTTIRGPPERPSNAQMSRYQDGLAACSGEPHPRHLQQGTCGDAQNAFPQ